MYSVLELSASWSWSWLVPRRYYRTLPDRHADLTICCPLPQEWVIRVHNPQD
jgi:hypothetical protein